MTVEDEGAHRLRTKLLDRMSDEPPPPPVSELVSACERGHRRRRRRLSIAAVVAVATVALVGVLVDRPASTSTVDVAAMSDAQLLTTCQAGNQSDEATQRLFREGTPTVVDTATVAEMSTVILLSADGSYWADCFINHYAGAEFSSGMTVYDASGSAKGIHYSSGFTCKDLDGPPAPPCGTFMVDYVDLLPAAVKAVDFTTADGQTNRVPTTADGFVLFAYSGKVPDGYSSAGDSPGRPWLTRITYLDQDGRPLAAANTGTSRPDEMRVGELPLLSKYPSRRDGVGS